MKWISLALILGCLAGFSLMAQAKNQEPKFTYELYSWRDSHGAWSFSIMGTTSRQKAPEEIFNEKEVIHGVDKLKRKISRLEPHSRLIWADKLTFNGAIVKGTEQL